MKESTDPIDEKKDMPEGADAKAPTSEESNPVKPTVEIRRNIDEKKSGKGGGCFIWGVGIFLLTAILGVGVFIVVLFFGIISSLEGGSSALPGFNPAHAKLKEEFVSGTSGASNKILLIYVKGVIMDSGKQSLFSSGIADSNFIATQLAKASEDSSVKAIILRLDTPGGEVTAADMIYHAIIKYKQDTSNPVVASMGSVAASGGVYVAVASDYIIANRLTTTGSIGVIAQTYNYAELLKKIGVKAETYTSGPMKDLLNGARPRTQAEIKLMNAFIKEVYGDFVKVVALGRPGITEDDIRNTVLGDGRFFSGRQALKYKLVDQLGYLEDAVAKAASMASLSKDDYQVVTYKQAYGLADLLVGMEGPRSKVSLELPGVKPTSQLPGDGKFFFLPTQW